MNMKNVNVTLLLILALFATTSVFAQQTPQKAFKSAKKGLYGFSLNKEKNVDKLKEAKSAIDVAVAGIDQFKVKLQPKVYSKAGEIYQEIANKSTLKANNTDASEKAMEYYIKSADHASARKAQKEAAKRGLENIGGVFFIQEGNTALQAGAYADAYKAFENVLKCKEKVDQLGTTLTFLLMEADQNNIKFYAGYAAYLGKDNKGCKKYFEPLMKAGFDESFVYSFLAGIYQGEENNDAAIAAINKGVTVMSNVKINEELDDAAKTKEEARVKAGLKRLLFDKINFYLRTKQMDKLEVELKSAIEQDKENAQLPFTLGQVYEDLSSKAFEGGKDEEGEKYFQAALDYYDKTLEVDGKFFDALYQKGAIQFNNAVRVYKIQAELGISADDLKKTKELQAVIDGYYEAAWKAFVTAEKVKANDALLIAAFKQIYLRTQKMDAFTEYKAREEKVKANKDVELGAFGGHPANLFEK